MKNIFFNTLTLLFVSVLSFNAQAQNNAKEEAAVLKGWDEVWNAYQSGDEAKMWAYYADDACEIYPDGSMACGLKNIREGYEQFKSMMETAPSWIFDRPSLSFLGKDVAILVSDVTADIKLKGGEQVGGKSKFAVVLHKINGEWKIAFDCQTPVVPMPGAGK